MTHVYWVSILKSNEIAEEAGIFKIPHKCVQKNHPNIMSINAEPLNDLLEAVLGAHSLKFRQKMKKRENALKTLVRIE